MFTGAMDYWPNIDAVTWFAIEVLPRYCRAAGRAFLYRRNEPGACGGIAWVASWRYRDRYRARCAALCAARCGCRRAASRRARNPEQNPGSYGDGTARCDLNCSERGRAGSDGREYEVAESPAEFAHKVLAVLEPEAESEMGQRARARITSDYAWDRNLANFDRLLDADQPSATSVAANESYRARRTRTPFGSHVRGGHRPRWRLVRSSPYCCGARHLLAHNGLDDRDLAAV